MESVRSLSFGVLALAVCAVVLPGDRALAGSVSVEQANCGAEVRLVADDAKLSEVFTALAAKLGFALRFDRDSDRSVSIESTRAPEKLIESLTRDDNVMITTADDPDCTGQKRITEVRFLAAGDPIVVPAHVPATAAPMPTPPIRPRTVSRITGEEETKRRNEMTPDERARDRERQRAQRRR